MDIKCAHCVKFIISKWGISMSNLSLLGGIAKTVIIIVIAIRSLII